MKSSKRQSDRVFRFGNSNYESTSVVEIPCIVGKNREKIYIKTTILKGDIPWLIGRETMENLKMVIDVGRNVVRCEALEGVEINVRKDERGHLKLALGRKLEKEEVWLNMTDITSEERLRKLQKLHLQFGHPGWERLFRLIEEARKEYEEWDNGDLEQVRNEIKTMTEKCGVCLRYKKTPARPVVGLPWAKNFNDVVAVDLGELEGNRFMMMVDLATKYCQAGWVRGKKPEEAMETLMDKWISIFGTPRELLSDNGGEFQNEKMRVMLERLNIRMKSMVLLQKAHGAMGCVRSG